MKVSDVIKLNCMKMKEADTIELDYLKQIKPIADEMVFDYAMDFLRKRYPNMTDKYLKIMAEDFIHRFDKKTLYQSAFLSQNVTVTKEKYWTNGGRKIVPYDELEKTKKVLDTAICNPKVYVRKNLTQDGIPVRPEVQSKSDKEKLNRETEKCGNFNSPSGFRNYNNNTFTDWRQPQPETELSPILSADNRKRGHKYCNTCLLPKENKSTIHLITNKQDIKEGAPENKKRRTIYDPSLDSPKVIPGTPQKRLFSRSKEKSKIGEPCKRLLRALEPSYQSPKSSPVASTSSSSISSSTSSKKYGKLPPVFQRLYQGQEKSYSRCSFNKNNKIDKSFNNNSHQEDASPKNASKTLIEEQNETLKSNRKFSENSFLTDDDILTYSFDEDLLVSNISSDTMKRFGAAENHMEELKGDIEEIQSTLRQLALKMDNKF